MECACREDHMRRRAYLAGGVGLLSAFAGCSMFSNDDPNPDEPPTVTTTPDGTTPTRDTTTASEDRTEEWGEKTVTLDSNDPETVVRTFYEALYAGDAETANELLHKDSPASLYTKGAVANLQHYDYALEDLHRTGSKDDDGTVVLAFTLVLTDSDESVQRRDEEIEVRLSGEDWKIWQ